MSEVVLQARGLRRLFGATVALDGLDLTLRAGEIYGLVGPDGAGKTTAMRMLACYIRPDSGTASVCGYDIRKNPVDVRRSLGYLAENSPAYPEMTVGGKEHYQHEATESPEEELAEHSGESVGQA